MTVFIAIPPEPDALARLQSISGLTIRMGEPSDPWTMPAGALDTQILFAKGPPSNLADLTALRLIQIHSAGYSQLFEYDLPGRGIRACNGVGNFDVPIAEWNVAMMVNLARDLRQLIRNQDTHVWDRSARFQREIRGLTLGIWGYGGIGRETARLAKTMGMRVHVLVRGNVKPRPLKYRVTGTGDPDGTLPDRTFDYDGRFDFLRGLDFLLLSMPLTKVTEGIIGEAELRSLPPTSFLLNPARGPLVQEAALLQALREGWIAGAAIDTHYQYPLPETHPLWGMPNVILTPHISGSDQSPRYLQRVWDIFVQNVARFIAGEPLWNELTIAQLRGQ